MCPDTWQLHSWPLTCIHNTCLLTCQTGQIAGDGSVLDSVSVIPLMFGQLGAKLRQLAVKIVLEQTLFNCSLEQAGKKLDKTWKNQRIVLTQLFDNPSSTKMKEGNQQKIISDENEIELATELELRFSNMNMATEKTKTDYSVYRTMDECDKWRKVWYGLLSHEVSAECDRSPYHTLPHLWHESTCTKLFIWQ